METLYFTLGIASVVVTAVAVGAVWAMFKVAKINSKLQDVEQQFGSTHRDITMVEQTIMNNIENLIHEMDSRFDKLQNDIDSRFSEVYNTTERISLDANQQADSMHREQLDRVEELNRYIDSRVDKLAARSDAYDLIKEKKQLIKG